MSPIKGPALFVDPTEPIRYPSKYASLAQKRRNLSDEALIDELTRDYAGEPHFGEATDLYTRFPAITSNVPGMMLRHNPGMKLIYLMRHPVDRLLSQFRFEQTKPLNTPPKDLAEYLRWSHDAISTSRYHRQLSRFRDAGFGPDSRVRFQGSTARRPKVKGDPLTDREGFLNRSSFEHSNATSNGSRSSPVGGSTSGVSSNDLALSYD
jgi:hypothetical protein